MPLGFSMTFFAKTLRKMATCGACLMFMMLLSISPSYTVANSFRLLDFPVAERQPVQHAPGNAMRGLREAVEGQIDPYLEATVLALQSNAEPQFVMENFLKIGSQLYSWRVASRLLAVANLTDGQLPEEQKGHLFALEKGSVLRLQDATLGLEQRILLLRTARMAAMIQGKSVPIALARAHRYREELLQSGLQPSDISEMPPQSDLELERKVASKTLLELVQTKFTVREESIRYLTRQSSRNGWDDGELNARILRLLQSQQFLEKVGTSDLALLLLAKQSAEDVDYEQFLPMIEPDGLIASENYFAIGGVGMKAGAAKVAYLTQLVHRLAEVKEEQPEWVTEHLKSFYMLYGGVAIDLFNQTGECEFLTLFRSLEKDFVAAGGDPSVFDAKINTNDC